MNREIHVRICEKLAGEVPLAYSARIRPLGHLLALPHARRTHSTIFVAFCQKISVVFNGHYGNLYIRFFNLKAIIMPITLKTPSETAKHIASCVQQKRLSLNFSQKTLSLRSGVSLSVIKKFEQSGKISLESLLKLALVLDWLERFATFHESSDLEGAKTIDELIQQKNRKRGRK